MEVDDISHVRGPRDSTRILRANFVSTPQTPISTTREETTAIDTARLIRTQDERVVDRCCRSQHLTVKFIDRQPLILLVRFDHRRCSVSIKEVDASVGIKRRGPEMLANSLRPMGFTCVGIQTRGNTLVGNKEDHVTNNHRRRDVRDLFGITPSNLRLLVAAFLANSDSQHSRLHVSRRDVKQLVSSHGPRAFENPSSP